MGDEGGEIIILDFSKLMETKKLEINSLMVLLISLTVSLLA